MSKKEKIQTVSWKDIQMVTTSNGREVYYFVSPKLEVFMDEDIANVETMICNRYHLADVVQDYLPVQNSKLYSWNNVKQYGYETNAELHSLDCQRETYKKTSDDVLKWHEQQLMYAKAIAYLPSDGGGH